MNDQYSGSTSPARGRRSRTAACAWPRRARSPTACAIRESLARPGGTVASYGREFQGLPLADAVPLDRFHLRVWTISAGELVRHLPGVWRGTYFPPGGVLDWAASAVTISWTSPHVIHIGGDLMPATTRIELALLPWTVPILRRAGGH